MTIPLIGITTYSFASPFGHSQYGASQAYAASVAGAGGSPVFIPLNQPTEAMETLLEKLDGVLFSGGGDIAPACYGGQPHPLVDGVDDERDQLEVALLKKMIAAGRPFLGICRGLQVINVALGGTLYEDILDQHPGAQRHQFFPEKEREHLAHTVKVENGSQLAGILGANETDVNSLHHQGIRKLASDLRATAFAPDGIIESVELHGYPYGLAVQWHPENLQAYPAMRALFRSFVEASAGEKVVQ